MSERIPRQDERIQRLMMAALDGELERSQVSEWQALLESNPSVKAEYERLKKTKEVTAMMDIKKPPQEVWDAYWHQVYNRFERGIAWILLSIGAVIVTTYGLWKAALNLWGASDMPWFLQVAVFCLGIGGAILIFSVLREKLFLRRRDPYKDLQR